MRITLKNKGNVYEQIVNEYKRFIQLEIIRNDEKLPSCRFLATELGVNPNTVAKAYSVLEEEGYIKVLPKKGVYVCYKATSNENVLIELKEYISNIKDKVCYEEVEQIIKETYRR